MRLVAARYPLPPSNPRDADLVGRHYVQRDEILLPWYGEARRLVKGILDLYSDASNGYGYIPDVENAPCIGADGKPLTWLRGDQRAVRDAAAHRAAWYSIAASWYWWYDSDWLTIGGEAPGPLPTATRTPRVAVTPTATRTRTATRTSTATRTPSATVTPTASATPAATATPACLPLRTGETARKTADSVGKIVDKYCIRLAGWNSIRAFGSLVSVRIYDGGGRFLGQNSGGFRIPGAFLVTSYVVSSTPYIVEVQSGDSYRRGGYALRVVDGRQSSASDVNIDCIVDTRDLSQVRNNSRPRDENDINLDDVVNGADVAIVDDTLGVRCNGITPPYP